MCSTSICYALFNGERQWVEITQITGYRARDETRGEVNGKWRSKVWITASLAYSGRLGWLFLWECLLSSGVGTLEWIWRTDGGENPSDTLSFEDDCRVEGETTAICLLQSLETEFEREWGEAKILQLTDMLSWPVWPTDFQGIQYLPFKCWGYRHITWHLA